MIIVNEWPLFFSQFLKCMKHERTYINFRVSFEFFWNWDSFLCFNLTLFDSLNFLFFNPLLHFSGKQTHWRSLKIDLCYLFFSELRQVQVHFLCAISSFWWRCDIVSLEKFKSRWNLHNATRTVELFVNTFNIRLHDVGLLRHASTWRTAKRYIKVLLLYLSFTSASS